MLPLALLGAAAANPIGAAETSLQTLYTPSVQALGGGASDLASADLDGDGDVDVLVAHTGADVLRFFWNDRNISFHQSTLDVGSGPGELAVDDVDRDGDPDVLVALFGTLGLQGYVGGGLRLLLNDGAGNLKVGPLLAYPGTDGEPVDAFLADVNEDGLLDAAVGLAYHSTGLSATGGLAIALGDGAGGLGPVTTQPLVLRTSAMRLVDVDGDGHLDAAYLAGYVGSTQVLFFLGHGDGSFSPGLTGFAGGMYSGSLEAGDWDGDGDVDLATGDKYDVTTFFNDGVGGFALGGSHSVGSYVKGLAKGDLDGDGDLDLAATSGSLQVLRVLKGDGLGHFAPGASLPAGSQAYAVMLADTNGDGYDDPWSVDVISGKLTFGASNSIVGRFGTAKPNSLGCLPVMNVLGTPSIAGAGMTLLAERELILQPALVVIGGAPDATPFLGGELLVHEPLVLIPAVTGAGSGNPSICDGTVALPASGAQLAALGVGAQVYAQVFGLDPGQVDGTFASVSDGLHVHVVP